LRQPVALAAAASALAPLDGMMTIAAGQDSRSPEREARGATMKRASDQRPGGGGGLFGGRGNDGVKRDMAARLQRLGKGYDFGEDPPPPEPPEAPPPPPSRDAEIVFVAGPRAGDVVRIEGRSLALDRDANETDDGGRSGVVASIWPQGDQFMLRHGGAILISGSRPSLPVIVLEDGDELAWGAHKLEFRRAPAVGR
jgi:hypothetical protein